MQFTKTLTIGIELTHKNVSKMESKIYKYNYI